MKIQHKNALRMAWHVPVSLLLIAVLLGVCYRLPGIDHATVALLVVAAIATLATVWGRTEALAAALGGGLGFDYYFLPPRGLGMEKPEHVVALVAFAFVAAAIGHLTSRMKQLLDQRASLLQLSLEPLCIGDLNGKLQSVNPAMLDLLGWSQQELLEKPLVEFIHADDRAMTLKAIQHAAETGMPVELENRYRTKKGDWRWLRWKLAPPATGTSWQSAAARDITEEKWAQEKLRDLAGQVMTAQEEERRRIARELHDDVTQRLATMGIGLGLLKQHSLKFADDETRCDLDELQGEVLQLSKDVRDLSHSLHPSLLEHSDLATNIEVYCQEFGEQSGIRTNFMARKVPPGIPKPVAVAIYRIAQESLRNVSRHANASEVSTVLAGEDNGISLTVMDNGDGFDVQKARVRPGLGLVSIEERVRQVSGEVFIESIEGAGTTLRARIPLRSIPADANRSDG